METNMSEFEDFSVVKSGHLTLEPANDGLYVIGYKGMRDRKICSFIKVIGVASNKQGGEWSRVVKLRDKQHHEKEVLIPMCDLLEDPQSVRKTLSEAGLTYKPNKLDKEAIIEYLAYDDQHENNEKLPHFLLVDQLGWYENHFVMPNEVIGASNEKIIFKGGDAPTLHQKGTAQSWRDNVAKYASGNSRLLFGISAAFSAPLLELANLENSITFHFLGRTSKGKTTILQVANSVYGTELKSWSGTKVGAELTAASHNSLVLTLDELGNARKETFADMVYLIGNGITQMRGTDQLMMRKGKMWHLIGLSTGEITIMQQLKKIGSNIKGGQALRFLEIDAVINDDMGIIEELHGFPSSRSIIDHLKQTVKAHSGIIGVDWLRYLVDHKESVVSIIHDAINLFINSLLPNSDNHEHLRAAKYFAIVAIGGELATKAGLTGWQPNEATNAAKTMFNLWLEGYGNGLKDDDIIVNHAVSFLQTHGESRFMDYDERDATRAIINRCGFVRRNGQDELEYLFFKEQFESEICNGIPLKMVIKALIGAGVLIPDSQGKNQTQAKPASLGGTHKRYYLLRLPKDE